MVRSKGQHCENAKPLIVNVWTAPRIFVFLREEILVYEANTAAARRTHSSEVSPLASCTYGPLASVWFRNRR